MATLFTDTFNRADSTSLGGSWTEPTGNLAIVSNTLQGTSTNVQDIAINSTSLGTNNFIVYGVLNASALWPSTSAGMGLVSRYTNTSNFNLAWCDSDTQPIKLYSVSGGTFSLIGTASPAEPSDPFDFELSTTGTTLTVRLNGVQQIQVTDSANSSGLFGVRTFDASTFAHSFDSLGVDDFVTGTPPGLGPIEGMNVTMVAVMARTR